MALPKLSNYKVGDKVWLENPDFAENVEMFRVPQEIEAIDEVEVTIGNTWVIVQSITLKGSGFIYHGSDFKKA